MSKTEIINVYNGFLDEMKKEIRDWWKTNLSDWCIDKKIVNEFKKVVFHEIIHYKIVMKHAINIRFLLELEKAREKGIIGFYHDASLKYNYPYKFNHPKYYPIFTFIQFKGFLFDIICDIFRFTIFTTFIYRLSKFLENLKRFKVRS